MAHFAKLENNKVTEIQIVNNKILLDKDGKEDEALGIAYLKGLFGSHTTWVQTSYNGKNRKQYAGVGDTYDATNDVFIVQQPFASWTLDSNFDWQPPTPYPEELGGLAFWDEDSKSWKTD